MKSECRCPEKAFMCCPGCVLPCPETKVLLPASPGESLCLLFPARSSGPPRDEADHVRMSSHREMPGQGIVGQRGLLQVPALRFLDTHCRALQTLTLPWAHPRPCRCDGERGVGSGLTPDPRPPWCWGPLCPADPCKPHSGREGREEAPAQRKSIWSPKAPRSPPLCGVPA